MNNEYIDLMFLIIHSYIHFHVCFVFCKWTLGYLTDSDLWIQIMTLIT